MKKNSLVIQISKPANEVFEFTVTPPNSTLWIPEVTEEITSEWPVKKGTIYRLVDTDGSTTEVTVSDIDKNKFVEWISKDENYHCRYEYRAINDNNSELKYYEWVDNGEIESPFTLSVLEKLKQVLESSR